MNASSSSAQHALAPALREPVLVRAALIAVALAFLALFVLAPLVGRDPQEVIPYSSPYGTAREVFYAVNQIDID